MILGEAPWTLLSNYCISKSDRAIWGGGGGGAGGGGGGGGGGVVTCSMPRA